jgi:hypothetical protein
MKYLIKILTISLIIVFGFSCGPSTVKKPKIPPTQYEQVHKSVCFDVFQSINLGIQPGILTKDFTVGDYIVGDYLTAANYSMPDNQYVIVDETWFKNHILPGFEKFLWNNGIEGYKNLRNDCDDFARAFTFYVRIKFRTMGFLKASPAIGDLHYANPPEKQKEFGDLHAINIGIFLDAQGNKVVRFIEPQNNPPSFIQLDEETIKYYIHHMGM